VTPTRIHHINFVVRDLEQAMLQFERTLGLDEFEIVEHRIRGSRVARIPVGETWLVLVCPDDPESVPGRYLDLHGEGFFLISLGYNDIAQQLEHLESRKIPVSDHEPRQGILDWQVADIGEVNGVLLQMTNDAAALRSD
jgi:hypothetical protein